MAPIPLASRSTDRVDASNIVPPVTTRRQTAASERAKRSSSWLTKRYGSLLRQWAAHRRAAWSIDATWTAPDLVRKLNVLCSDGYWHLLDRGLGAVSRLDFSICHQVGARIYWKARAPLQDVADPLSIDEVERLMRIWFPRISRNEVRKLLLRLERRRIITRKQRGVYIGDPSGFYRRQREEDELEESDEEWHKLLDRLHRDGVALIVHYLLPKVPVYRKAAALKMSERNFHYSVGRSIADLTGALDEDEQEGARLGFLDL